MNNLNTILFQIYPYVAIALFLILTFIRAGKLPYSAREKSAEIFARKSFIIGTILFHIGIIIIILGHFFGLLSPIVVFEKLGISHGTKQIMAISIGGFAGFLIFFGLIILLSRRIFHAKVRSSTTIADYLVLILLLVQVSIGLHSISASMKSLDGADMLKLMAWAQGLVTFKSSAADNLLDLPRIFKIHILVGFSLFLVLPFSNLVHLFNSPIYYIFRPWKMLGRR